MKLFSGTLLVLFALLTLSHGQQQSIVVKGRVTDKTTRQPVSNANVFLANTTMGTYTGRDGEFLIKNIPAGNYTVVFSFLGYETQSISFSSNKDKTFEYYIELKPKAILLNQVNVQAEIPEDWKKKLKVFVREFIGQTENAAKTRILNQEAIEFTEGSPRKFEAYTDSILVIENKGLGYRMHVVLKSFSYDSESGVRYEDFPRFEELKASSEDEQKQWEVNRKNCYLGSRKHFFNALINRRLKKEKLLVYRGSLKEEKKSSDLILVHGYNLSDTSFFIESNNDSTSFSFKHETLDKKNCLRVIWMEKPEKESIINFSTDYSFIDQYGNLLESEFTKETYGYWATHRLADLLPGNYVCKPAAGKDL